MEDKKELLKKLRELLVCGDITDIAKMSGFSIGYTSTLLSGAGGFVRGAADKVLASARTVIKERLEQRLLTLQKEQAEIGLMLDNPLLHG